MARSKKVNLSEEAEEARNIAVKDEVTEELLEELCPATFRAAFKKAKTPAARADILYAADKLRLLKQKDVAAIETFCTKLGKWFIQTLPDKDATGVAGKVARVQVVKKVRPNVVDWGAFYTHIKKKGEFELLNRAVNAKSVAERWDNGKQIPGVEKFNYSKISITKVK